MSRGKTALGRISSRTAGAIGVAALLAGLFGGCSRENVEPEPEAQVEITPQANIVWITLNEPASLASRRETEEWKIREATFRHQLREGESTRCYLEAMTTVAQEGRRPIDLPDGLLKRLAAEGRAVKRRSECQPTNGGVVDKATGETGGVILQLGDIRWRSNSVVQVSGDCWRGPLNGATSTYSLEKAAADGAWQVTAVEVDRVR